MKVCDYCDIVFDQKDCPLCVEKELVEELEKEVEKLKEEIERIQQE